MFITPLRISCRTDLMEMDFPSSCLSGKDFIPALLMKLGLMRHSILGWKFFFLRMLKIVSQSLLAWKISPENSTLSLNLFPFYVIWPFSLAALKVFFCFVLFDLGQPGDYMPYWCSSWCKLSHTCTLDFLYLDIYISTRLGTFFWIISQICFPRCFSILFFPQKF